jgi:hypothetical protein
MKTLLLSLAMLFALAGCAASSGGTNFDFHKDNTSIYEG